MADELLLGGEVKIRAKALYDAAGRRITFRGVVTALGALTFDATIRFNGTTLNIAGIPYEMGALPDAGSAVDEGEE